MRIQPSPDAVDFLVRRRSVTAKNMQPIAPSAEELKTILQIGTRVPDHGKKAPWKINVLQGQARGRFGRDVLAPRFAVLHPDISDTTIALEAQRFERAGVVLAVLSTPVEHPKIPVWEMELSAGAVCAHLLIAAQAMGYGAQWLTEWTAFDDVVLQALGGTVGKDRVAGFIYIGEATEAPLDRDRPDLDSVVTFMS